MDAHKHSRQWPAWLVRRGFCWLAVVVGVAGGMSGATGAASGVVAAHWKVDNPPAIETAALSAVAHIPGTSAFWAVGFVAPLSGSPAAPLIERRSGHGWSTPLVLHPRGCADAAFRGVAAKSARDAWAVGYCEGPREVPLAYHWNGASWRMVPSPRVGKFGDFRAVTVTGRGKVVAVGSVIAKWNGFGFVAERTPALFGNFVGVAGGLRGGVWAVGTDGTGVAPRVVHRGPGTGGWKVVPTPTDDQLDYGYASVVTANGGATVWVVGGPAVERYHAGHWTVYQTPTADGSSAASISRLPSVPIVLLAANGSVGMSVWAFDQGAWHRLMLATPGVPKRGLAAIAAANAHTVEAVGWRAHPCEGSCSVSSMLALRGS